MDVEGFGGSIQVGDMDIKADDKAFKENSFDGLVVDKVDPLVRYEVINSTYRLKDILEGLGLWTGGSNMFCPFHPDALTGKPSAKYHEDSDLLYCFSENKIYSAYHAIKLLYNSDVDKVFNNIWGKMSKEDKMAVLSKHGSLNASPVASYIPSSWETYSKSVLSYFEGGRVNFKQYKNALFKVYSLVYTEEEKKAEGGSI